MISPVLECRRIGKRFGGVAALCDVDFDLRPGEIHALCGENGAGKSTLIKILGGIHPHGTYDGEVIIDGKPAAIRSVADTKAAGIAVIYQELALVDEMTVAENLFLGKEPVRGGLIDWPAVFDGARRVLQQFAIDLDPRAPVRELGIGKRQLVEVAKALAANSRILILDEPTAALSEHEVRALLQILRNLRSRGVSCLYISHRLEEIFSIADRLTVLRDGRNVATFDAAEATVPMVIRHMVGREIGELFPRHTPKHGAPLLRVLDLEVAPPEDSHVRLADIQFDVHEGEVLGIGGLMGAGRTELLMHLFGAWGRRVRGTVSVAEQILDAKANPRQSLRAGLVLVSEDRKRFGLVTDKTVGFNLSLSSLRQLDSMGLIDSTREHRRNSEMFRSLAIKASGLEAKVGDLSGGNQQKVVLGKALLTQPRVILLDEPTRGIDIGAKVELYGLMNRLTAAGCGIVLVSSELEELMSMSDRILMLHNGRIGGTFARGEATQEQLLAAAMGRSKVGRLGGWKPSGRDETQTVKVVYGDVLLLIGKNPQ